MCIYVYIYIYSTIDSNINSNINSDAPLAEDEALDLLPLARLAGTNTLVIHNNNDNDNNNK